MGGLRIRHGARPEDARAFVAGAWSVVLVVCLALLLAGCDQAAPKVKRTQVVRLLPDTPPPPPPPPPKEEKKPEPQKDEKPQPAAPKPVEAPQPQALKTDEAPGAGTGGGLVAGSVSRDYAGEQIGSGLSGADSAINRMALNAFANATTRALNDFLAREKDLKLANFQVAISLWLRPDGALERVELTGSSGDASLDRLLRAALNRFPGATARPPEKLPQPLRLLVSNRMLG